VSKKIEVIIIVKMTVTPTGIEPTFCKERREERTYRQCVRRRLEKLQREGRSRELGVEIGREVGRKLQRRNVLDNSNRVKRERLMFAEEFEKYSRVLLRTAFGTKEIGWIDEELDARADITKKERVEEFEGRLQKDMIVEGASASTGGGIGIPGCPLISGFIEGLKEEMGWEKKKFVDISYLRTPNKAKGMPPADLQLDVVGLVGDVDKEIAPIAIYFPTQQKEVFLHFQECGKKTGRPPKPRRFRVPAGAILFYDSTTIKHATWEWKKPMTRPPRRVNILLHGVAGLKYSLK
jgi:predicted hydrocarbon binding protein